MKLPLINIIDEFIKARIFPYLSVGYIFLVFLGYVISDAYYSRFKIDIFNYLSPTEILIPTISFGISLLLLSLFVFMTLTNVLISPFDKEGETKKKKPKETYWAILIKDKCTRLRVLYFSILIILGLPGFLIVMLRGGPTYNYFYWEGLVYLIAFIWFLSFYLMIRVYQEKTKEHQLPTFLWFIPAFIVILLLVSYFQILKSQLLFNGKKIADISITSNNETIIETNDTLMFIGQTSSHMFFWNLYNEEPEVLNLSNFSKLHKLNTSSYFSGILHAPRSYEKHPLFEYINEKMTVNERVEDVIKRREASIYNRKIIIPEHAGLIYDVNGVAKGTPLSEIEPPYQLIKNSTGFEIFVVKNRDTLLFKAGTATQQ